MKDVDVCNSTVHFLTTIPQNVSFSDVFVYCLLTVNCFNTVILQHESKFFLMQTALDTKE